MSAITVFGWIWFDKHLSCFGACEYKYEESFGKFGTGNNVNSTESLSYLVLHFLNFEINF